VEQVEQNEVTVSGSEPFANGYPEHGRVPRYFAVKVELSQLMRTMLPGQVLPTERELAEQFSVSRLTVRQAVDQLVLDGKVIRRQGKGSFVSSPKLQQPMSLVSYTEAMRSKGITPNRILVSCDSHAASVELAQELRMPAGDVIHLERVLVADDERVGLESTFLPLKRFERLLVEFDPTTSLYAYLRERYGIEFASGAERVETVLASPREALLVGTNPALPMLLLHRVSYDAEGTPIERVRTLFRGDRFSLSTQLSTPQQ
jgi:GntR family transcriptional regulator